MATPGKLKVSPEVASSGNAASGAEVDDSRPIDDSERPTAISPAVDSVADSPPVDEDSSTAKSRRTMTWVAGIALTAATAFAAWSAWSWHDAATAPTSTAGATRDEAVAAGRTLIATVTTFDPHHRDQDLARWQAATTGALQTTLPGNVPPDGSATTGHVLDAGLSDLDSEAGTAKLLASVEITVSKDGAAQPIRRTRLAATLTRTASGWKLSTLEQLGVAGS
ncbi:hypothetical protein ACFORO_41610 [Amycolatopsis halotolerans]|uniref:Mce-associated membrane protein n=1 Tax=Amycolatopsis halotolerans TaxID=330083 RepID=A0ABV7QTT2_9PSEU